VQLNKCDILESNATKLCMIFNRRALSSWCWHQHIRVGFGICGERGPVTLVDISFRYYPQTLAVKNERGILSLLEQMRS